MAKVGKTKRLTRLVINEVSAVTRGAGEGVQIRLMKAADPVAKRRRFEWDGAYGLIPVRKDGDRAASIARAKAEIAGNLRAVDPRSVETVKHLSEDHTMRTETVDVVKTMTGRITEIIKSDPSCRSPEAAMLRLAESRDPGDQALWREYKGGTALEGAVAKKEINVEKTLRKLAKRVGELQAIDPNLSHNSAIAKIAASTDAGDRELWGRYKAANEPTGAGEHLQRPRYSSPSEMAIEELIRSLKAQFPKLRMSPAEWRSAALRTQRHQPLGLQRFVPYRI